MTIAELIKSGTNVTFAVSANDLRRWHEDVITSTQRRLEESVVDDKTERYLTAQQVCDKLSIDMSTLWRWAKRKYLVPLKVGGQRRYKLSEVESLLER